MKHTHPKKLSRFISALLSFAFFQTSHAALVNVPAGTAELSPVVLGGGTIGLTGTVVAFSSSAFSSGGLGFSGAPTSGTVRSMVVATGGNLDFYYQILNNSTGGLNNGNDIFRFVVPNFTALLTNSSVAASYRPDSALNTLSNTGILPAGWLTTQVGNAAGTPYSADRDAAISGVGGIGFDLDSSQFINFNVPGGPSSAPGNIDAGKLSDWLVVRTLAAAYASVPVEIESGSGSASAAGNSGPLAQVGMTFRGQGISVPQYLVSRYSIAGASNFGGAGPATNAQALAPAAVPEPSTWAMLAAGTASLLAHRRQKRKAKV